MSPSRSQAVALAALAVALTAAAPTAAQIADATPTLPILERCRIFCSSVYKEGDDSHAECITGCREADVCMDGCRQRFQRDKGKQGTCFKRCMDKGRPFEMPTSDEGSPGRHI